MKKRIRQGQYTFPDPEWTNVSNKGAASDPLEHRVLSVMCHGSTVALAPKFWLQAPGFCYVADEKFSGYNVTKAWGQGYLHAPLRMASVKLANTLGCMYACTGRILWLSNFVSNHQRKENEL